MPPLGQSFLKWLLLMTPITNYIDSIMYYFFSLQQHSNSRVKYVVKIVLTIIFSLITRLLLLMSPSSSLPLSLLILSPIITSVTKTSWFTCSGCSRLNQTCTKLQIIFTTRSLIDVPSKTNKKVFTKLCNK